MIILTILRIIAAVGTIAIGLFSLIRPKAISPFTGLEAPRGRGITEIRAIFGGVFIGVGAAPLILGTHEAYQVLGIMYLVTALVRTVSIFLDKSAEQSNIISVISEYGLGIILVI